MITPGNINNTHLSAEQKLLLEKAVQQDDLNYLSALAFEQFKVTDADIDKLQKRIDKKLGGSSTNLNTVFVSLLCGLFIGLSVFFVIFQKSKTHASVYQSLQPNTVVAPLNKVNATDTVFPERVLPVAKVIEHYNSVANQPETPTVLEMPEPMNSKEIHLPEIKPENDEEIILSFSPNAPTVFINNLKITNYRLYYFKQNQSINLSINTGLAAQYENNASVENSRLNASSNYYAHKIIQQAMKLFSTKNYVNCIEELNFLYDFNKNDANAQFYLGMCYYFTGKYTLAQTFFQKNLDNDNNIFHQESEFYLAMCLLNTKQTDKALAQLHYIISNKGFYSARALEMLKKI